MKDFMDRWRLGLISDVECMTRLFRDVQEVLASMNEREKIETDELFSDEEE